MFQGIGGRKYSAGSRRGPQDAQARRRMIAGEDGRRRPSADGLLRLYFGALTWAKGVAATLELGLTKYGTKSPERTRRIPNPTITFTNVKLFFFSARILRLHFLSTNVVEGKGNAKLADVRRILGWLDAVELTRVRDKIVPGVPSGLDCGPVLLPNIVVLWLTFPA